MRGVHWTLPSLIAEVSFAEWTDDGRVRHASFLGLREDKKAEQVRVERAPKDGDESSVAGVRLSTPNRIYYPDLGLTKRELAAYYETMAERIRRALPHVPAEKIIVAPDCGMKYLTRDIAFGKLQAMVAAAEIVRREQAGSATNA